MSAKANAVAKAQEAINARKAANPGKKKTVLNDNEISVRYIEIQNKRCFAFTRVRIYDQNDINNPTIDVRSGWSGNFNDGDQNKDMQRKFMLDLGRNIIIGRIYFDQFHNGHSGRYYPNGASVILKDSTGKVIPTQYLDGDKVLSQHGHTDLRYNLSLKPKNYDATMNEVDSLKKDAEDYSQNRMNKAKETTDKAIADKEAKVNQSKSASETRTKNAKYSSEERAKESQRQNKCKSTNQIYNIQYKTMKTYCDNMGNTAQSQDARCQNLKQQKDPECFTNVYKCDSRRYFYITNFMILFLIFMLFIKWYCRYHNKKF